MAAKGLPGGGATNMDCAAGQLRRIWTSPVGGPTLGEVQITTEERNED